MSLSPTSSSQPPSTPSTACAAYRETPRSQHAIRTNSSRASSPTSKASPNCIRGLQTYGWQCTLQYVPSHVGIIGNDNADDVVKVAAEDFAKQPLQQREVHRGAITARHRRFTKAKLLRETLEFAWHRHTGGRRVVPPRELRRAGERVIMGIACGQHPLVIPRMSGDPPIETLCSTSHHGWCPHCLNEEVPQQKLRDTAHTCSFALPRAQHPNSKMLPLRRSNPNACTPS